MKTFYELTESFRLPSHIEVIDSLTPILSNKTHTKESVELEANNIPPKLIQAILNNLYLRGFLKKLPNEKFKISGSTGTIRNLIKQSLLDVKYPDSQ